VAQIALLGITAMLVALVSDGAYAVLTGRAGAFLTKSKVRLVSRLSGGFLIGGGVWLALTRR
jgi:homoserine/homoserine lactone efflux protein